MRRGKGEINPRALMESGRHPKVEQWFHEHHDVLLRRLASVATTEGDVRDLAQEVFLRVLRVSDPDLVRFPRAYLLRVAAHVIEEWRLRGRRFVSTPPEHLDAMGGPSDPTTDVDRRAQAKRVNAALQALPPMYRSAIALRAQYGLTVAEVAVRLGVTERMVKRYIEKGYARLRRRLAAEASNRGRTKG